MTIRHARSTDLDALDALEQQCFPPEEAATRASFAQRLAVFPEHFWLAECERLRKRLAPFAG